MLLIHEQLLASGEERPVLFIRYNPHTYYRDGVWQRVSGSDSEQADQQKKEREEQLVYAIREAVFCPPRSMSVLYMYYDCYLGDQGWKLNIQLDSGFCLKKSNCAGCSLIE